MFSEDKIVLAEVFNILSLAGSSHKGRSTRSESFSVLTMIFHISNINAATTHSPHNDIKQSTEHSDKLPHKMPALCTHIDVNGPIVSADTSAVSQTVDVQNA
jgi:hypothetical protein